MEFAFGNRALAEEAGGHSVVARGIRSASASPAAIGSPPPTMALPP